MTRPYELIVFDWEGTLADTLGQVMQTIQDQAAHSGYLQMDHDAVRQGIGVGLLHAIKKGFAHLSSEAHHVLLMSVQKALCEKSPMPCLFSGAIPLIVQLHQAGLKLAIATNKGSQSLQMALQKTQLLDFFEITRSAGQAPPKPHPQMLLDILDACGVEAEKAVMIGDSASDMEMAAAVSVDAVGVDWYDENAEILQVAGAKKIVHHFDELATFLGVSLEK